MRRRIRILNQYSGCRPHRGHNCTMQEFQIEANVQESTVRLKCSSHTQTPWAALGGGQFFPFLFFFFFFYFICLCLVKHFYSILNIQLSFVKEEMGGGGDIWMVAGKLRSSPWPCVKTVTLQENSVHLCAHVCGSVFRRCTQALTSQ